MPVEPPGIPDDALAEARRIVDDLHTRLAQLAADLEVETPMAVDLAEESRP
jgi:hypothetical protein